MNQRKLYLSNWCHKRLVNYDEVGDSTLMEWSPTELNSRSTSRVIPIRGGDTLQFYRTLSWIDRTTSGPSFNRYVNPSRIGYSVELVSVSTNTRVMLLDTVLFEQTTSTRKPCLSSWYPTASRVRHIVPSHVDSTDAVVRISTWAFGAHARPFYRKDRMSRMKSDHDLSQPYWTAYSDSVEANIECGSPSVCDLVVSAPSAQSGLNISVPWPSTLTRIDVCDLFGTLLWSSAVPLPSDPAFAYTGSGLRIVVGKADGHVVCTRKVIVP